MYKFLLVFVLMSLTGCSGFNINEIPVQVFVRQVAKSDHLPQQKVINILNQAQVQPQIIAAMNRPFEQLSWAQYQKLYVRPSLIAEGIQFWQENQNILAVAAKQYGVPPQLIIAILGVETAYGRNIGQYRALDALYTLAFDYPHRARFFQNELADFLILTIQANFDPLTLKSSYAGALGIPQFMPSNYLEYAVTDTNQYPNLFTNNADAINSIANYFERMGWQKDQPIAVQAHFAKNTKLTDALKNNTYTLQEFKNNGIDPESELPDTLKADLVILQGADGVEYWLTFHNFYVIKKYNSSNLYAMAVYQLARKINHVAE